MTLSAPGIGQVLCGPSDRGSSVPQQSPWPNDSGRPAVTFHRKTETVGRLTAKTQRIRLLDPGIANDSAFEPAEVAVYPLDVDFVERGELT